MCMRATLRYSLLPPDPPRSAPFRTPTTRRRRLPTRTKRPWGWGARTPLRRACRCTQAGGAARGRRGAPCMACRFTGRTCTTARTRTTRTRASARTTATTPRPSCSSARLLTVPRNCNSVQPYLPYPTLHAHLKLLSSPTKLVLPPRSPHPSSNRFQPSYGDIPPFSKATVKVIFAPMVFQKSALSKVDTTLHVVLASFAFIGQRTIVRAAVMGAAETTPSHRGPLGSCTGK